MPLGYGKYVRSDRVTAIVPIEEERGPGRRTFIFLEDQAEPLVASRAEDSVIRDLVREPQEITRARQQQELLRDIGEDLATVNETLRQIVRDRSRLDLDLLERRITRRSRGNRIRRRVVSEIRSRCVKDYSNFQTVAATSPRLAGRAARPWEDTVATKPTSRRLRRSNGFVSDHRRVATQHCRRLRPQSM